MMRVLMSIPRHALLGCPYLQGQKNELEFFLSMCVRYFFQAVTQLLGHKYFLVVLT
jgi:hypothetical protein